MTDYETFLASKARAVESSPVPHGMLSASLFPHQRDLVEWALRRGRAAIFASTGLGKSRCEIEWALHVTAHTHKPVLILAPLAVARQMVGEGELLGMRVKLCREQSDVAQGINVTNYDRLHLFDPAAFGGVVLDESSCIKSHDAKRLALLLESFAATPYKLCASATPAPNSFMELGTHAEFLGVCSRLEMLSEFFVHDGGSTQDWRLKGHAVDAFWSWVASWGAVVRHPRDLGHETEGYDLPPLELHEHISEADHREALASGMLFAEPARSLNERRGARKASLDRRVEECCELVNGSNEQWLVWCELNAESEALAKGIPGSLEVRGSDDADVKEERLLSFARGEARVLVSKPRIAGWGLNLQGCSHMAFASVSDSWESYYQAVRRCWRFGQARPVHVHVFASELEGNVLANLKRKEADAERMAEEVSRATREAVYAEVRGSTSIRTEYRPRQPIQLPAGLISEAA